MTIVLASCNPKKIEEFEFFYQTLPIELIPLTTDNISDDTLTKIYLDLHKAKLNSVQSSIYVHKVTKDRYRVPGNFSNEARKIYQAINLKRDLDAQPIL